MNFSFIKPASTTVFSSGPFSGIFDAGMSTYLRFTAPIFTYDGWSALLISGIGDAGAQFASLFYLSGMAANDMTYAQYITFPCNGYIANAMFYNGVTATQSSNAAGGVNAATAAAVESQLPSVNVRESPGGAVGGVRVVPPLKYWTLGTYSSGGVAYSFENLVITAIY